MSRQRLDMPRPSTASRAGRAPSTVSWDETTIVPNALPPFPAPSVGRGITKEEEKTPPRLSLNVSSHRASLSRAGNNQFRLPAPVPVLERSTEPGREDRPLHLYHHHHHHHLRGKDTIETGDLQTETVLAAVLVPGGHFAVAGPRASMERPGSVRLSCLLQKAWFCICQIDLFCNGGRDGGGSSFRWEMFAGCNYSTSNNSALDVDVCFGS